MERRWRCGRASEQGGAAVAVRPGGRGAAADDRRGAAAADHRPPRCHLREFEGGAWRRRRRQQHANGDGKLLLPSIGMPKKGDQSSGPGAHSSLPPQSAKAKVGKQSKEAKAM
ncbi:hypothetical protein OsI_08633 [Oryza sativa Indica Group]|uniref:Uncharacterized protein n=1 Tax=Oryza sativa subsp. indica TaxID=39946 RepID=A2X8S1_ORYSI|nr:hypothetical protein OsI_08633 [Oryza sativa Indica Group]